MKKTITIEGVVATHRARPQKKRITIDAGSGLITQVSAPQRSPADYVFGPDCLIFPGFSDIHIHAREDETGAQSYKEEYKTAADAALNGGVVAVCAMPNTPSPVTGKNQFQWHRSRIGTLGHAVSILNYVGIDQKSRPLGKPGEHLYKLYFGKSVGDLTVTYGSELEEILARYRGQYVSFHVEYEPIVQASKNGKTHSERRPVPCVNEGLRILLPLIEKYKIHAKLCHWSTGGESFEMIQAFRKRGCDIVLEVSPLHLLFDTSMTDADPSLWTKIQMNPAVQAPEHRKALIKGLKEGFIQYIATDHAPHTEEEKFGAFARFALEYPGLSYKEIAEMIRSKDESLFLQTCTENNMSGAPWLDTYALVCALLMRTQGFTPQMIARVAAYEPGLFVNRFLKWQFPKMSTGKGFGEIAKGNMGSFTVISLNRVTTIRREDLKTKCGWSPLEDWKVPGGVEAVFVRGERVK